MYSWGFVCANDGHVGQDNSTWQNPSKENISTREKLASVTNWARLLERYICYFHSVHSTGALFSAVGAHQGMLALSSVQCAVIFSLHIFEALCIYFIADCRSINSLCSCSRITTSASYQHILHYQHSVSGMKNGLFLFFYASSMLNAYQ